MAIKKNKPNNFLEEEITEPSRGYGWFGKWEREKEGCVYPLLPLLYTAAYKGRNDYLNVLQSRQPI